MFCFVKISAQWGKRQMNKMKYKERRRGDDQSDVITLCAQCANDVRIALDDVLIGIMKC